ncbi:taste receptor type 1 member 1-like [Salarias fasciatus]|uniref:taste receptor type 1 member 1-like n=1 Tax=Salarias fasciatus TaxID=181472 RepID=UPI001176A580|nr:taste receptor type 1 member 1-like [Salarias fasciatus]
MPKVVFITKDQRSLTAPALAESIDAASEFHLEGDYLIGGLFDIHPVSTPLRHLRPEAIDCSSQPFSLSNYQRFQLMRFTVEEINNSTTLLPNVSLGYEIFDHCSDISNFPGIFDLISINGLIEPWTEGHQNVSSVVAVTGPFTSTQAINVAPLFMADLIPMVSYSSSSSVFTQKQKYGSFLRTAHPNSDTIEVIVNILLHFNWRWVAFLNSDTDYGQDGLDIFRERIKKTEICMGYSKTLSENSDYSNIFQQINAYGITVIIVFSSINSANAVLDSAIRLNVTNKVWVATDSWSLNKELPKKEGLKHIGTVVGVSQPVVPIPGFHEFIYSTDRQHLCGETRQQRLCNQVYNCSELSDEDIYAADPSFSFFVYSAIYAIAHALHNTLQCGAGRCINNMTVYPHMVLAELKKSNFTLLNQNIHFDENGDPGFGSYSVVFWNRRGEAQEVGFYHFYPSADFSINDSEIQWHTNGEVPVSLCSHECSVGFAKKQNGIHKCCFTCEICPNSTYINATEDPYTCVSCTDAEWSAEGSTSCSLRVVEFIPITDTGALVIMVAAWALVGLSLAVSVLFAINFNTPVVRSAGGPMCFLILICLSLCSICVYFHFGRPTAAACILRFLPFLLFYTVCLACFVVRSLQVVCIFKIAAKLPTLYSRWMRYHGQWWFIAVIFAIQAFLLLVGYGCRPPGPHNETVMYPSKIILSCDVGVEACTAPSIVLVTLCFLCFIFSYMGKDLPKNYNEAKSITFCLILLTLTWTLLFTIHILYQGKYIQTLNGLAIISSLYSFLLWYFVPKCVIIIFQPQRNTQQYFQGLIQSYTKTISQ